MLDLTDKDFEAPGVRLWGTVDYNMYGNFRAQLEAASGPTIVVVLSTLGGDPEVARMMGEDIRYASELYPGTRYVFLGKSAIYSAGTTFMSFFVRQNRFLTRGTRLMIHERRLTKDIKLEAPLTSCASTLRTMLNDVEASIAIQNEGFQNLVAGSEVSLEDVLGHASENWYLEAEEARRLGLIQGVR